MRAILYARVTTSDQREASLDDQFRECEELCRREGFTVVARESDHGMSGESIDRPGYQRVLQAVERGDADVVVAHELSRLWRSQGEQAMQVERFEFRGRHVVTCDGADTRRDGFEFLFAVKGAQSKTETKRIASRVHRTHKGLALAGRSTGGRTYGYRSEPILDESRKDAYGRPLVIGATRMIDAEAAEVVRKIFTWYADGMSPRRIAAQLNALGVASPGAAWQRKTRRTDAKWLSSTIHGDPKRGSGILNCETYIGRVVWNRRQMKKRPGTSKRVAMIRTAADLITRDEPALRIISDDLWQRTRTRQAKQARELGTRVIGGLRKHRPGAGRPSKYVLSGLLKCEACHAGFVMSNGERYQCASHTNGGDAACNVSLSVQRTRAENIILGFTERELPTILAAAEERYSQPHAAVDHRARIAELEKQVANYVKMIGGGEYSPAVSAALKAAESELTKLRALDLMPACPPHIASREPIERRVKRMREQLAKGGDIAQGVLLELFPIGFWLRPDSSRRFLWAITQTALPDDWRTQVDANGYLPAHVWPRVYSAATELEAPPSEITEVVGNSMVAGARYRHYLPPFRGCKPGDTRDPAPKRPGRDARAISQSRGL
jgi:site-specific DNA recombinase